MSSCFKHRYSFLYCLCVSFTTVKTRITTDLVQRPTHNNDSLSHVTCGRKTNPFSDRLLPNPTAGRISAFRLKFRVLRLKTLRCVWLYVRECVREYLCVPVCFTCLFLYSAAYPFHFHMLNDATGMWFRNNSIHHSLARCVTVHATHNAEVGGFLFYCPWFRKKIEGSALTCNWLNQARYPAHAEFRTLTSSH